MGYIFAVREFIVQNFLFGDNGYIKDDTSFLGTRIIDSTGILELVSFLEATYGISISDDELLPENLDTLKNIERFLEQKVSECPDKPGMTA